MNILVILTLARYIQPVDSVSIGGAKNAFNAAKKFLTGTRKAKSTVHGTPFHQTAPGAVSVSGQSDGIMKKSVDFLTNGALIATGIGTVWDHFKAPEPTVSSNL